MRLTFWVYLIGALALAGIFPLAGFWSKDEILAEALLLQPAVFWLLLIAAFFTAFYMGRQIFLVFFGEPRSEAAAQAAESPPTMTVPLLVLAFLSVFGGLMNLPVFHTFATWLEHSFEEIHPGEFILFVALSATIAALAGILLSWLLYRRRYEEMQQIPPARRPDDPLRQILGPVFTLWENKYWVDELYWTVILNPYVSLSRFLAQVVDWRFWHDWFHDTVIWGGYDRLSTFLAGAIDLGVIDGIANGLAGATIGFSGNLRRIQTGFVRNYALSVFLGVILLIGYLILR